MATAVAAGELRTIALAGGAAPAVLGGRYRRIVDGAIDDHGDLAVSVELAGSAATGAVLLIPSGAAVSRGPGDAGASEADTCGAGGRTEVVALAGDAAPGGGQFRVFRELDLANGGQVLFRAELDGCPATEGLFLRTRDNGLRAVVRAGADNTPTYASFSQPTLVDVAGTGGTPALACVATLAGGRECVLLHQPLGEPAVALCSGSPLGEEVVEGNLAISRLGIGLCCVARVRRGDRLLTTALALTCGGAVASDSGLRTGALLPGYGRITRLLTPPAASAELGFVTVGLADGRMALCRRSPVPAEPSVVLASGDQLPGVAGEWVRRVGPPVASSFAMRGPFGVACPIRLHTGRAALWVGVFGGQPPSQSAAVMPWLDGERTVDHPQRPVGRLFPVKFGSDGTLLLRAVLGDAGERRTSLLALSGLFGWHGAARL